MRGPHGAQAARRGRPAPWPRPRGLRAEGHARRVPRERAWPAGRTRRGRMMATEATITVTQIRSAIGTKPKQRGTLRALGLGRIGKTNTLPDRPEIRGMLARVPHLISVEEQRSEEHTSELQSLMRI